MEFQAILLSAVTALIVSVITAYWTSRLQSKQEKEKWERELTQKIVDLTGDDASKSFRLIRQYAVGFLTYRPTEVSRQEKAFIPPVGRFSIGRGADNDLPINSRVLSKHHAVIEVKDSKVYVIDLNSTTGTYLNNDFLMTGIPYQLKGGYTIRLGDIELIYYEI